jgi:hypothetical protein
MKPIYRILFSAQQQRMQQVSSLTDSTYIEITRLMHLPNLATMQRKPKPAANMAASRPSGTTVATEQK